MSNSYKNLNRYDQMFSFFDSDNIVFHNCENRYDVCDWCTKQFGDNIWNNIPTGNTTINVKNKDGIWDFFAGYYFFKNKDDAIRFKLTWVGQ